MRRNDFNINRVGDDAWIKEWCLSLQYDGWAWAVIFLICLMKQDEQQLTAKSQARFSLLILTIQNAALLEKYTTYGTLVSVSMLFIRLRVQRRFTAKSLAIVCALLMDSLPVVVKWPPWPHSTHVHWQESRERWADPQQTKLTLRDDPVREN